MPGGKLPRVALSAANGAMSGAPPGGSPARSESLGSGLRSKYLYGRRLPPAN